MDKAIKRGEMWLIDFGKSEKVTNKQLGIRPAIILQNSLACEYSPITIVIPLSSNIRKAKLPTHVILTNEDGVIKPSFAMAEQIQTIDKTDLLKKLSIITDETMSRIEYAAIIALGLNIHQIKQNVV